MKILSDEMCALVPINSKQGSYVTVKGTVEKKAPGFRLIKNRHRIVTFPYKKITKSQVQALN
jgi:hypothetical protein